MEISFCFRFFGGGGCNATTRMAEGHAPWAGNIFWGWGANCFKMDLHFKHLKRGQSTVFLLPCLHLENVARGGKSIVL